MGYLKYDKNCGLKMWKDCGWRPVPRDNEKGIAIASMFNGKVRSDPHELHTKVYIHLDKGVYIYKALRHNRSKKVNI